MITHAQRLKHELKAAGVSRFGMHKFAVRYLPKIIDPDEHVMAVIYGRYREKDGPSFNEGLLVATDRRIIFLDHKPGYTKTDEIGYNVVSGVKKTTALFSAVSLHTRIGDYNLRFVNAQCANIFQDYIERRLSTRTREEEAQK